LVEALVIDTRCQKLGLASLEPFMKSHGGNLA
jgi:hypothetical protein